MSFIEVNMQYWFQGIQGHYNNHLRHYNNNRLYNNHMKKYKGTKLARVGLFCQMKEKELF